jgi:hypothetical protein
MMIDFTISSSGEGVKGPGTPGGADSIMHGKNPMEDQGRI